MSWPNSEVLSVHLDGQADGLPASALSAVLSLWLDVLREVERRSADRRGTAVRWVVQTLSMRSPACIGLTATGRDMQRAVGVAQHFLDGVTQLEAGTTEVPAYFSEIALRKTQKMTERLSLDLAALRFRRDSQEVNATRRILGTVDALLQAVRELPGTVEGRLEIHGDRVFAIYDPLMDNRVECHFAEEQLSDVGASIGARVVVTGTVRYNRMGRPLSMKVLAFKRLREQHELPQARDVEGLAVPAGVHPDEHLRRLRDGGGISSLLG
jgi:hypothetical protein